MTGQHHTKETKLKISSAKLGCKKLNPVKKTEKVCPECKSNFLVFPSQENKVYCNGKCYGKSKKGISTWNKGLKGFRAGEKRPYMSKKGEDNPCWIKDRTKLAKKQERNDPAYKEWRRQVYSRDNWKCRMDNDDCNGRIYAHHILGWTPYPELRYKVNNGITLCKAHHPRKRNEEIRLSPYFQNIISTLI